MNYRKSIGHKKIQNDQILLGRSTWPEFMQHDSIVEQHWSSLYNHFLDYQFAIYSDDGTTGVGNSIPLLWEDDISKLPNRGLDWAMEKAADDFINKKTPNLLIGVQILINPDSQNRGLSYELLDIMKEVARAGGIEHIALPVRPTLKHRYPLISLQEYSKWTNQKGEPYDPWIRVHTKAGGNIVSTCEKSMTIEGEVKEWERWTGLCFQSSGLYLIDKALCPVRIDIENNIGEYIEPNLWITHAIN